MNQEKNVEIIESLQKTVEQMRIDDIEESPEGAHETFQCQSCGEEKILAGSVAYNEYLLCNDCVLIAEISFTLDKIKNIEELIKSMEDKRFDAVYKSIFEQNDKENN